MEVSNAAEKAIMRANGTNDKGRMATKHSPHRKGRLSVQKLNAFETRRNRLHVEGEMGFVSRKSSMLIDSCLKIHLLK